ncbi:LysR family transcriptional regulator [Mangrovicoccus ximenensis]|uniref:LysR family transcriptional regulator n=1 Tax=Mangrovicoccus ximenensis TaxID=1911570 RepID=UPI000D3471B6|nr:LysR family transcriptional regulator [Mangrovicoccus ximenensis]
MDLRRLQTFLRVAETGSLSAASDRLRIAQPALSRQIRMLEDEVGQVLFTRSREGMALTAAGELLQARVSGLLRQLEQGVEDVRSMEEAPQGKVAVGLVPSAAAIMGADFALAVRRAHPGIRLNLQQGYTSHLLDWVHRGDLDMALVYRGAGQLPAEQLVREELLLVGPRGHPLLDAPAEIARLDGVPMVLPSAENGLRLIVDMAAERAGMRLGWPPVRAAAPVRPELRAAPARGRSRAGFPTPRPLPRSFRNCPERRQRQSRPRRRRRRLPHPSRRRQRSPDGRRAPRKCRR